MAVCFWSLFVSGCADDATPATRGGAIRSDSGAASSLSSPTRPSVAGTVRSGADSASDPRTSGDALALPQGVTNLAEVGEPGSAASPPPVIIDGRAVPDAELRAMLAESSGGVVIEELALDRALEVAMKGDNLTLTAAQVEAERSLLAESLAQAAGVSAGEGESLIEQVRRNRGLGPVRFEKLLRRNAMLRALVRARESQTDTVTDDDLRRAYDIKHGPRVRARLILVRSLDMAVRTLARVNPRDPSLTPEPFGEVAAEVSIDPTSQAGGRVPPVSAADPSYPEAVRRAFATLNDGEISEVLAVAWPGGGSGGRSDSAPEQGYAIVKVEGRTQVPGAPSIERARADLIREIRTVRERAAMDRLARDLTLSAARSTTIFDRSLDWSWTERRVR